MAEVESSLQYWISPQRLQNGASSKIFISFISNRCKKM